MAGIQNDAGVSVIIGTLLLILITVTAAAGLALMVSQMQKDEMNRQSHLTAVKSEKIEIQNIHLNNDRVAWNQTPFNITENQSWNNWSSITLTLSNLNIEDVKVIGIAINDRYARNYSTVTDTPNPVRIPYNFSNADYLALSGSKSQKIQINFTDDFPSPQYIQTDNQVRIRVMTSLYNNFEKIIKPPNPVFTTKIETEDLGSVQRKVLVLDGSASTADTMVTDWNWTIENATFTTPNPGNWSDTANIGKNYFQGKTARVELPSSGPFRVRLTVTDDVGISRISNPVDIPADQNYVPPANFQPSFNSSINTTVVEIRDINGNFVNNSVVQYILDSSTNGNLSLSLYLGKTVNGTNSTSVICRSGTLGGSGIVKVLYGNFQPVTVMVSNISNSPCS